MTQMFQSSDGLHLAYDDAGARGCPVLLCLAGLTRNMADFEPVLAEFGATARILRMDYRGRGRSDYAADHRTYTIPREAQDALDLLDHLGLDSAAILGTSRGGLIAMEIADKAPRRLSGALLNDIGPIIELAGLQTIFAYLGQRPGYASYGEAADKLPAAMAPAFVNVPRATWRAYAERLWRETPDGLDLRYDPRLRDAVLADGAQGEITDPWPYFEALVAGRPVGLLRGANSDLLSAESAAEMRARAPDMLFAEVPDRGHVPFLDEPEARALIADFLGHLDSNATARA
ncbi:MAG: alpha/beta hydrolase [Pseudomonadota bacterium]